MGRVDDFRPLRVSVPAVVEVEFNRCDYADAAVRNNPSLERIDGFTVRRVVPAIREYTDLLL